MQNHTARRARIAAVALAPIFVLAGPAIAFAATDPGSTGNGQDFSHSQTTTTPNGVRTTTTDSCVGPDGQASFHRNTSAATENGRVQNSTSNGSVCGNQQSVARQNNVAQNNSNNGRSGPIGNQPNTIGTAQGSGAPLVVVNNPVGR